MGLMQRTYHPISTRDKTLWIGKFTGWRVLAWGKAQVLRAVIEVRIRQEYENPAVWVARAAPGDHEPLTTGYTAEDCMVQVAAMFTTCIENWQGYGPETLKGVQKLTPTAVVRKPPARL